MEIKLKDLVKEKDLKVKKRFKMVSIAYTHDCVKNPRCSFCYLKKDQLIRSLMGDKTSRGLNVVEIGKLLEITEQIAIAYNGLGVHLLTNWLSWSKQYEVIVNVTANPEFLTPQIIALLKRNQVAMVALSLDPEKCSVNFWLKKARELKKSHLKVSANILMLDEAFKSIAQTVRRINLLSQQIHLLRPKFYKTAIPMETRREIIFLLKQKYKNLFIDECFKWEFTGEPCRRGKDFVSINPDDSVSLCSFDIYRENKKRLKKCPYI